MGKFNVTDAEDCCLSKKPTSPLLIGPPWKQECSPSELLHGPDDSLIYVFENSAIKTSKKWRRAQLNMVGK